MNTGALDTTRVALGTVSAWPAVATAGLATIEGRRTVGPADRLFQWASVTKVLTSLAIWLGVEEGIAGWDDDVGPPGSTLAHLLAHASGLEPDGNRALTQPGRRRIYSNRGIELAAEHVATEAGMPFSAYVRAGITEPLGMTATTVDGSPASSGIGPLVDLLRLGRELLAPTLVDDYTVARATTPMCPGLPGVLPGFGHQEDNSWGLGVEIRDNKSPHWTGLLNSPATFGHFGQSGSFIWVDPERHLCLASLADRPFGPWAVEVWPSLSDSVITALGR